MTADFTATAEAREAILQMVPMPLNGIFEPRGRRRAAGLAHERGKRPPLRTGRLHRRRIGCRHPRRQHLVGPASAESLGGCSTPVAFIMDETGMSAQEVLAVPASGTSSRKTWRSRRSRAP